MFLEKVKSYVLNQQIYPTFLGLFINPFYFSRKNLLINIIYFSKKLNGNLLDIGCGNKPYQKLFEVDKYVGLEFDSDINRRKKKADFYYNGNEFPFAKETFDSIITTQVLEHVCNTNLFLIEINRVLKKDGICLITVPFIYAEHEVPLDFFRFTSFGLKDTLIKYGFEIKDYKKSTTGITVLFQLLNEYIYKKISNNNAFINMFLIFIFISPFNIIGSILSKILPNDDELFLDNVILLQKINNI